jgi:nitric oxide reductase large subunit
MYQPYPTGAQLPVTQRPPVPPSVTNAVRAMYVGALTSILGIAIDIITVGATKRAIEKRNHHLTMSQINSVQHVLVIAFIIGGLIGAAVWLVLARLCRNGKNGARITGTVIFGLATLDTLIGVAATPIAGAVRAWGLVVWLVGLVAVVLLWRPSSNAFFKGVPPQ